MTSMLKKIRNICLIGGISIVCAIAVPARASCVAHSRTFGQLTTACASGTAYCYLRSPGLDTTASILGSFWSLGSGSPAPGPGNDNGSWVAQEQWLRGTSSGIYLLGDWGDQRIDGCIAGNIPTGATSEIMTVELSDTDIFNEEGFFAAAAVARHSASTPEFDFAGGIQRDVVMAPIPLPYIGVAVFSASSHPVYPQDVSPGFYSDGTVTQGQVIVGYRIYYREGAPPPNRHRSAWNAFSPVVPLGQPYVRSECFCCGGWPLIMTFAVSLVFADGFETDYLSREKTRYLCIPENSQDLDGDGDIPPEFGGSDCNDFDDTIYTNSPEINDGKDNQCPGAAGYGTIDEISGASGFYHPGDKTKFTWHTQTGATSYELARSDQPNFAGSCASTLTSLGTFTDAENPSPGSGFYYVVRAAAPHIGSWGKNSAGAERTIVCP